MKKLSVLFAAVMMFVTVGVANAQKVASMDYEAVLAAMPETKKMTSDLDIFSKSKGDELNKQAEAFQKEVQEYQAGGAKLTEAQLNAFFDAGYTQENAIDVILGVSLATLCNYVNNIAETPINPELQAFS